MIVACDSITVFLSFIFPDNNLPASTAQIS